MKRTFVRWSLCRQRVQPHEASLAPMAAQPDEGDYSYVIYDEVPAPLPQGQVLHQRVILARTAFRGWFMVATPDQGVYAEELDLRNADLLELQWMADRATAPRNPLRCIVYPFREDPVTWPRYDALVLDARRQAATFTPPAGHGLPANPLLLFGAVPAGAGAAPAVGAPVVAGPAPLAAVVGESWVFAESFGRTVKGDGVPSLVGAVGLGDRGVVPVAAGGAALIRRIPEATIDEFRSDDLRVLPVAFDNQGERRRTFATAVAEMNDQEPEGGMVNVTGPRTALWSMKDMLANGGSPASHHDWWLRAARVPEGDRSTFEMETLLTVLETLAVIDQVNVPALSGCELLCRRVAVIKEAHRLSPSNPDYSSADYFMGWGSRRHGATQCPALTAHVSEQLKNDSAIAKEARKAREERVLKSSKKPKGKGKGNKDDADAPPS